MAIQIEWDFPEGEETKPKVKTKKRNNPVTSRIAHESVKEHKQVMYEKIIEGLEKLKVGGTFEEIATAANIQPAQAWKRISELVESGVCFNVGITRPTSSGRQAMVRQLTKFK